MSGIRQREGLIARVKQVRQVAAARDPRPTSEPSSPEPATLEALGARIAHLERQLDGIQDAVHRESVRQGKRIAELESRLEPAALAVALSRDARERGI
ncbi:MAG: hypothetical protein DLM64_04155 [Solirubrobacterales bacterium]|nr:MAG: hypothetical protein DLM64_04155 [Solirubrobacterales bacterium]